MMTLMHTCLRTLRGAWLMVPLVLALSLAAQSKLTLDGMLQLMHLFKIGYRTEQQTIDLISGADFEFTPENVAALRKAGATDAILNKIRSVAPAPPAAPTGTVSIRCLPAECDVKINGEAAGTSVGGHFTRSGVPAGQASLEFEHAGYASQKQTVKIAPKASTAVSVTLEPTSETKAALGRRLFQAILAAAGDPSLEKFAALSGGGGLTTFASGKSNEWNFHFAAVKDNEMDLEADTAAGGGWAIQCVGEKCDKLPKGGILAGPKKTAKKPVALDLENNLRIFAQYQFAAVLRALKQPGIHFTTSSLDGDSERHLRADAPDTVYEITTGSDALPSVVTFTPKSGLGAVNIVFADFALAGQVRYPKRTQIRLASQDGIEVRLDTLNAGAPAPK